MMNEFWKEKSLKEMTHEEWESLCDGCGKCCLQKLQDEETGQIYYTQLSCHLMDNDTARCTDYQNRLVRVPSCIKLTRERITEFEWLPFSCAYRRVYEGRGLADWHYLVCGDRNAVHRAGVSVAGRVIHNEGVLEEDWEEHIIHWVS